MSNLLLSATLFDSALPLIKWLTIGILGLFAITLIVLYALKLPCANKIAKILALGVLFYVLGASIFLLISGIFAEFGEAFNQKENVIYYVFLPILITLIVILVCSVLLIIINKKKPSAIKLVSAISCALIFVCVVISLVMIYLYYQNTTKDWYKYNSVALWVGALILVIGVIIASLFLDKKGNLSFDTKCLTTAGVCISLSFVLSYIKLFDPPTGGSITLASLLPVMLFAYVYGMKKGLLIGFIYGILQAVQEPWLVHPAQFLLDYPIAFSMVGLAGVFNNFNILKGLDWLKFSIGAIFAVCFRFASSVLAGIFAWEATLVVSLTINAVILLDVILVLIVGIILFSSKGFKKELFKLNPSLLD